MLYSWIDPASTSCVGCMTHNSTGHTAFPVRTQQFTCDIDDSFTDFLLCAYADCVMVTVTQTETLGTIFQSRCICMCL